MALNKVGGILMLIGLFLPAVLIMAGPIMIMLWIFGLMYWSGPPFGTLFLFSPGIIDIVLFIVLLIFSILCIAKESGRTKVFGILSLVFICIYFGLIMLVFTAVMLYYGVGVAFFVIPFLGFILIFIGSIMNIASK